MVVGGLLLIGVVLISVVWVLLVSWLLGLFYEVRVWLRTGWYGYVGTPFTLWALLRRRQ